jgi:2-polyprenyl-3-methyl-5-hydroxy-6-metoxy-1,4-benzoquinol methylase
LQTPSEFERAYLETHDPRAQSGFRGSAERWEAARRPIVEAIDRPGAFLDVGCANGLLMESIADWSPFPIETYGVDFAPGLVELARGRLPQWADRVWLGDAAS